MYEIKVFTDASVNPKEKIGFAAYFLYDEQNKSNNIKNSIKFKKFENTSSSLIELQAVLFALENKNLKNKKIKIFTDCQNILSLIKREENLKANNFKTKSDKELKNKDIYIKFFKKIENLEIEFIKIKGHKKTSLKDENDILFSYVDKASRKKLREYFKEIK